jgi:hypothetical protein
MIFDSIFVKLVLIGGMLFLIVGIWMAQRSNHPFDLRDTLMDQSTGKASLNACIILMAFLLSLWVVVDRENDGKDDVPNLLLGVLGIFVLGRLGAQGINAWKNPTEPGATVEQTTVRKETVTTVPPPPPPKARR